MKKHMWKIVAGIVVVVMGGSILYSQQASQSANDGVVLGENIKGNSDSSVVLTEYADFQCPACAQFHPIVKAIQEQYGDQLAIEFKHFPLISIHPHALPAAKAAEAAGVQGKFFEMHDMLFENQAAWSKSGTPQVFFNQYAEELGLDVPLFKKHMRASMIEDRIREDLESAIANGFTGTPSFLLNGEVLEFETYEEFISKIESALGVTQSASSTEEAPADEVNFGI